MEIKCIGTGSKGNCYLLDVGGATIILDCGVRAAAIKKALDYELGNVLCCLITHAHKDHCRAAEDLMKFGIEVYASPSTIAACGLSGHRLHTIDAGEIVAIDNIKIQPILLVHCGQECLGYIIHDMTTDETLIYATDTSYIHYAFVNINYYLIECNHTEHELENNRKLGYIDDAQYKRSQSHMSLESLLDFFESCNLSECKQIILVHMSDRNSSEKTIVDRVNYATGIKTCAARNGEIYKLDAANK